MEQGILASDSQDREFGSGICQLQQMCPLHWEGSSLSSPSFCYPRWLSTGGENPTPVWPDAPQNPWPSLYVGLATLSKGHAFHHHALKQFLAQPQHYLLSLSKTWAAKEFFISFRVPRCRCIQNENLGSSKLQISMCEWPFLSFWLLSHILSLNTNVEYWGPSSSKSSSSGLKPRDS